MKYEPQLSLSKSQIAFLSAVIEFLREEETGRIESVTIALDEDTACEPLLVVCDRKLVIQALGSLLSLFSPEQAEALSQFCLEVRRSSSLDELLEIRERLEGCSRKG